MKHIFYAALCVITNLYAPVHIVSINNQINPLNEPCTIMSKAILDENSERNSLHILRMQSNSSQPCMHNFPTFLEADAGNFIFWLSEGTLWYSKTSGFLRAVTKTDNGDIPIYETITVGALLQNLDPALHYRVAITILPAGPVAHVLAPKK